MVLMVIATLLALTAGSLRAEVPHKINYQGRIEDNATGEPLAGSHSVAFRIYDEAGVGTLLWSESQVLQADSAGIFSAILGSITPIEFSFDGPLWLEVEVGGETLSPRREMVSVPFALRSEEAEHCMGADSLGGHSLEDFVLEGETSVITSAMIVGGAGSGLDADMVDGLNADAFADTGHAHDARYWPRDSLSTPGSLNQGYNPVDWTRLRNVPAGFADGSDDGGVGDGHSLDANDGDPVDAVYVDSEGHVGIGSTSPLPARLVVTDSSTAVFAQTWGGMAVNAVALGGTALNGYADGGFAAYLDGQVYMTGDVGIGTLDPERMLHLMGDNPRILIDAATSNPEVNFRNAGDDYSEMWSLYKDDATDDLRLFQAGDRVTFEGVTGNVGIGTENPVSKLDIAGACNVSLAYSIAGSTVVSVDEELNTHIGLRAGEENGSDGCTFVGYHAGLSSNAEENTFLGALAGEAATGGDNTMLGASAGRFSTGGSHNTFVGVSAGQGNSAGMENTCIGAGAGYETGPGSQNTLIGSGAGAWASGSRNVMIGYGAGALEEGSDKLCVANGPETSDILIFGDFAEGKVGIGTDSPAQKLHLAGDNPRLLIEAETSNPEINFKSPGDPSAEVWALYKESSNDDLYFLQDGTIRVALKTGTNAVGIGTNNVGTYELYVQGEAYATGGWTPSDLRFKDEIGGIENALDKVLGLRGVLFRWKTEEYGDRGFPEGEHYGVIAQEAEKVLPEIVKIGPDGDKAVAYSEIIPVLIESIRELKSENDDLKKRLETLESR
jgi:hypothetical protein